MFVPLKQQNNVLSYSLTFVVWAKNENHLSTNNSKSGCSITPDWMYNFPKFEWDHLAEFNLRHQQPVTLNTSFGGFARCQGTHRSFSVPLLSDSPGSSYWEMKMRIAKMDFAKVPLFLVKPCTDWVLSLILYIQNCRNLFDFVAYSFLTCSSNKLH